MKFSKELDQADWDETERKISALVKQHGEIDRKLDRLCRHRERILKRTRCKVVPGCELEMDHVGAHLL